MNKSKMKNGYIYVLVDSVYPDTIKIGYTGDLTKRIQHFNRNKPYKTAKYIHTSVLLNDVCAAYRKIFELLLLQPKYQHKKGLNKGWHDASNREAIEYAISEYFNI